MTERDHTDHVREMLDAVDKAARLVAAMDYTSFAGDDKTAFAAVRALEVIGL